MEEVPLARRALLLKEGRLVFDGTPQALFAETTLVHDSGLEEPAATRFLKAFPFLFPGIRNADAEINQLLEAIPPYTGKMQRIDTKSPPEGIRRQSEIEIQDLSHVYMANTPLAQQSLVSVTMTVTKDIPHGLVGSTGSGKSTLLQHLNGLYRPQHGSVRVGTYDLNSPDLDVKGLRRYAGLVFQNLNCIF